MDTKNCAAFLQQQSYLLSVETKEKRTEFNCTHLKPK